MRGNHLQVARQNGKLVVGLRPETRRRRELAAKTNRSQADNIELILLQQRAIMEHFGID